MGRRGFAPVVALAIGTCIACARFTPPAAPRQPATATALPCVGEAAEVTWTRQTADSDRAVLDRWCASVGPPVIISAPRPSANLQKLVVISWNVHVGGGRVADLLARVLDDERVGQGDVGVVLLLQEAFRAGLDVPPSYPPPLRVPSAIRPRRPAPDVVALADQLGMSMAYVPSMRNGPGRTDARREDRGNAILSTEPLSAVEAIELPFGRQRRVALAATIAPRGHVGRGLRAVSMHLDTDASRVAQARFLASHLRSDPTGGLPLVVGGDLNSLRGTRDGAYRVMAEHLSEEPCGTGKTNVWPARLDVLHGWWRGRIDFLFRNTADLPQPYVCWTVRDRYGSDHRPVVMVVDLP